ncbi:MAG: serine hydrolase domain-containing protein [Candidatus Eiseniibacteriota bacterium]
MTDDTNESTPRTAADMVELAKKATFLFEPGTSGTYSSGGYAVLARVLELASGQDYSTLVRERVFAKLDLAHTSNPTAGEILPGRAPSYVPGLRGIENAPPKDLTFLVGAGSVFSNARDLHTLTRAVVEGKMGEGPRQSFVRSGKLNWNGSTNGYRAFADYDSATGVAVAFCGNVHSGANDLMRQAIPAIVKGEAPPPTNLPAIALDPRAGRARVPEATLKGYEGVYQLGNGTRLDVRARDGVLAANEWILVPMSDSTFFSLRDYGEVRPVPGPDKRIERLDWKVGSDVWPAPRVAN